ncbi:MAG: ABC transporter permease subunit [Bdellovibrionota bacterium]
MKTDYGRMFRQVAAISYMTFQELLREKILWSSFVFGLLCVGLAYAASQLSYTDNARIALDFGLTSVSLVGGLISIIMGSVLIAKEVQNRTLYLILTKSVWRSQFVVGRLIGLLGILSLNTLIMVGISVVVFLFTGGDLGSLLVKSLFLQVTEFGVLAAIACIFSVFSTATLAAIFSSGVWVIGHAMTDLKALSSRIEPEFMRPVLGLITNLLPDLTRFDIKAHVAHDLPVTWTYIAVTMGYGFVYIVFALAAACLIFRKRDL